MNATFAVWRCTGCGRITKIDPNKVRPFMLSCRPDCHWEPFVAISQKAADEVEKLRKEAEFWKESGKLDRRPFMSGER